MRSLLLAALLAAPAPAVAQWRYDPVQSMAVAYCSARAAGQSEREAIAAANNASLQSMGGGFMNQLFGVITQTRAQWQQARFVISRMCPELIQPQQVSGWPSHDPLPEPERRQDGSVDYGPVFR